MDNEDLDAALVAWDIWRERNPDRDFKSFAQEHNLSEPVCTEVQRTLSHGNDIGKMAFDFLPTSSDMGEREYNSDQCSAITKQWLTDELGHRFDIKSPLGFGGMGTVWLAEQNRPIRRKVAIKLIRNDLVSPATRKRFAFEQQALASLSHPNIATVHEAGETQRGRSYFIMEYIPGEKITDFCNRRKLDLLDRLKLFLQVCDGVQYAHRRGLIHRDLKPGNVIVMEENKVPIAKVIDFGLAKGTAKFIDNESLTHANTVIGSPAWMSPEQAQVYVDGDKVEVDTRTDVYSLGVVLYQLLTNSTPIRKQVLRESPPAQVFDAIRNQLPASPSRRLGERKDDSKSWIEDSSNSGYSTWVGSLKDDLDWVVMKAIEKDASRRYENIGEFTSDIKRFIEGESVTARPPSKLYHLKKIVGRNRILASSIVAIVTTLIVATGISTSYAIKANRAQKLAERRLKGSEQLTEVFASGFEVLSYFNDSVENTELKKELLREVGKQMEAKAAAFPPDLPPKELAEREYLWRSKYVESLESAQMDKECIEQIDKIVEFLSPVVTDDDERLVNSRIKLSNCLLRLEDFARAKQVAADNLLIVSRAYSPNHGLSIRSEIVWLRTFIDDRTFEENEYKFNDLIERAGSLEKGVNDQIDVMRMAATHAFNAQENALGIEWLDRAQKLAKEKLEKNSVRTVDLEFEYWMQVAFSRSGRKVDLNLLEARIRSLSNSLGKTHPTVIRYQTTLARILNVLSHFGVVPEKRPLTLIRKTLETSIVGLGAGHPQTSVARSVLLRCLSFAGRFEELLDACDEHLELLKEHSGEDSDLYINSIGIYMDGLLETEQYEVLIEKARLFQLPREEARALIQLRRYSEAVPVLTNYIESKDPKTKVEFGELVSPYMLLAKIAFRRKDFAAAIGYLNMADEHAEKIYSPAHEFRLHIKEDLLINHRKMGKPRIAIQKGKELLDTLLNQGNTMSQELRSSLHDSCLGNLVEMYMQEREFQSAEKYALLYLESPITHKAVQSQDYIFKFYLGVVGIELGNDEKAEQYLLEALEAIKTAKSSRFNLSHVRENVQLALRKLYRRQGKVEKLEKENGK